MVDCGRVVENINYLLGDLDADLDVTLGSVINGETMRTHEAEYPWRVRWALEGGYTVMSFACHCGCFSFVPVFQKL